MDFSGHFTCGLETWECISCAHIADAVYIRLSHYANVDVCAHKYVRHVTLISAADTHTQTHLFEVPALLPLQILPLFHLTT